MENSQTIQWKTGWELKRYSIRSMDYGLQFVGKTEEIECFVDASLGISDSEGKSVTGLVLKIFGDIVFWKTKMPTHDSITLSRGRIMAHAARELISLGEMSRRLLQIERKLIM